MARILVVDDEPDILDIVSLRLELDGHTVETFESGEAALEAARTHPPDLIVLDVMMPGMNGFEVLRELKSDPSTLGVAIVMLTAKSDLASAKTGWDLDIDNYVTKPFHVDEFADIVRNVLISHRGHPLYSEPALA